MWKRRRVYVTYICSKAFTGHCLRKSELDECVALECMQASSESIQAAAAAALHSVKTLQLLLSPSDYQGRSAARLPRADPQVRRWLI